MSTHTTHFCDECNQDHDSSHSDGRSAINYSEMPTYEGWAEFQQPYTDSLGYERHSEIHICAHCLANPEFEPRPRWTISDWDTQSKENLETGRKHAEAFAWALENLGTRNERWGHMHGVRQVFDNYGYGYEPGPKLENGEFYTTTVEERRAEVLAEVSA